MFYKTISCHRVTNFYGITHYNKKKNLEQLTKNSQVHIAVLQKSLLIQFAPLAFPQRSISRPEICQPQAKPAVGHGILFIFDNMLTFPCNKFPGSAKIQEYCRGLGLSHSLVKCHPRNLKNKQTNQKTHHKRVCCKTVRSAL